MNILLISASLNKKSRSFVLAHTALEKFRLKGKNAELIDLRDYDLPFCDAGSSFSQEQVRQIRQKIEHAQVILIAAPVLQLRFKRGS